MGQRLSLLHSRMSAYALQDSCAYSSAMQPSLLHIQLKWLLADSHLAEAPCFACFEVVHAMVQGSMIPQSVLDCSSVMEDDCDQSRHVLTQGKNSREDWIARGNSFMDSRLFDLAAHCFQVARDAVRFTVALAYASYMNVKSNQAALKPAQLNPELFKAMSTGFCHRI